MILEYILKGFLGLLGLGLLVFIHEMGHFLAARAVGIQVEAFALGWGPTILRRKGRVTEYRLAAFPIGGYCKMKGEQDMADAIQNKTDHMKPTPGSFFAARPWQRMIVSFAGPLVNLVFAVLVMGSVWLVGYSYESTDNRISLVSDYPALYMPINQTESPMDALSTVMSPASQAGLKTGDRISAINGKPTASFRDVQMAIAIAARQTLTLDVERQGEHMQLRVTPLLDQDTGGGRIGVSQWIDPIVARVIPQAGTGNLRAGDRILSIEGHAIKNTLDIDAYCRGLPTVPQASLNQPLARVLGALGRSLQPGIQLEVERNGSRLNIGVRTAWYADGHAYLAFAPQGISFHTPAMNPGQALVRGTTDAFDNIFLTIRSLGYLFQGLLSPTKVLSGPVRITYYIGEVATQGFSISFSEGIRSYLSFLAFVSVALFFGNLLPIPALDGGQILLFIGEAISRRPLKVEFVQKYQIIGLIMVLGMLILAIYGDALFTLGL